MVGILILAFFAVVTLILGWLFLTSDDAMKKIENALNKPLVDTANIANEHAKLLGLVLVVLSGVLIYLAFSLRR